MRNSRLARRQSQVSQKRILHFCFVCCPASSVHSPDPRMLGMLGMMALCSWLTSALTKPRPGDWLASHEELGQSFPQYAKRMNQKSGFSLPRPACDGLLICTFGASFDSAIGRLFMPHLIKYCTAFFGGMHVDVCDKPFSLNDVQCRENDFGRCCAFKST